MHARRSARVFEHVVLGVDFRKLRAICQRGIWRIRLRVLMRHSRWRCACEGGSRWLSWLALACGKQAARLVPDSCVGWCLSTHWRAQTGPSLCPYCFASTTLRWPGSSPLTIDILSTEPPAHDGSFAAVYAAWPVKCNLFLMKPITQTAVRDSPI